MTQPPYSNQPPYPGRPFHPPRPAPFAAPTPNRSGLARPTTWLATACMGLMAGLFYAFAVAVMPGLARTEDRTFVASMQAVNRAIENLPFAVTFVGSFVFTGAAAFLQYRVGARAAARWILASLALYVVAMAITMGVSIPLNEVLAGVDLADAAALATARADFEGPWTAANVARALACTLALGCLGYAQSVRSEQGSTT